jgi:hypothetical protein
METSPLSKGFWPTLGAEGLWAGRDLYRATPAVTWGLGFPGLIRRTAPFSRLLRPTRGCGGSILTGPHSVASYDTQGDAENLFLPGSSRVRLFRRQRSSSNTRALNVVNKLFLWIYYNCLWHLSLYISRTSRTCASIHSSEWLYMYLEDKRELI